MSEVLASARSRVHADTQIKARIAALEAATQTALAIANDSKRSLSGTYTDFVVLSAMVYEEYILTGHASQLGASQV